MVPIFFRNSPEVSNDTGLRRACVRYDISRVASHRGRKTACGVKSAVGAGADDHDRLCWNPSDPFRSAEITQGDVSWRRLVQLLGSRLAEEK